MLHQHSLELHRTQYIQSIPSLTYLTEAMLALTLTLAHFTPVCTTHNQLATPFLFFFGLGRKPPLTCSYCCCCPSWEVYRGAGAPCLHKPDWRGHCLPLRLGILRCCHWYARCWRLFNSWKHGGPAILGLCGLSPRFLRRFTAFRSAASGFSEYILPPPVSSSTTPSF